MESKIEGLTDLIMNSQSKPDEIVKQSSGTNFATTPILSYADIAKSQEIVGTGSTDTILTVDVKKKKLLYVSHLRPETTAEVVQSYINKTFNVDPQDIKVWSLIPKNRNVNSLEFISFKVSLPEDVFDSVLTPELWPCLAVIRPFIIRQPKNGGMMASL